ncbi:MAG: hypothetical protein NC218_11690 [Acetobacter sp.]|nr:hypothetical protein [Acetobacter sp.]
MNIAAVEMMEKYGLVEDENLMTSWLNQTHGTNHMPWSEYLLFWSQAKEQFLMKLFGGELIKKYDISFSKATDEIVREMSYNHVFSQAESVFYDALYEVLMSFIARRYDVEDRWPARQLADNMMFGNFYRVEAELTKEGPLSDDEFNFLMNMTRTMGYIRHNALSYTCLAENRCGCAGSFRIPEASKPFQVVENQKPFKMLTTLVKYLKPYVDEDVATKALEAIENYRIVHSQVLNTKNTRGRLCLSIHPMDYMTMSDNGCDWHSCMRWDDEDGIGEYHAGTLEMMTSPSVVVAYLESKDEWHPVHNQKAWSNKKWRELFIVTPDFITGIKGYPYCSDTLENVVFDKLTELMAQNCGVTFDREYKSTHEGYAYTKNDRDITFRTYVMYNDCEWNGVTTIFAENFRPAGSYNFYYGQGAYCIKCGKLRTDRDEIEGYEDSLLCDECCGRHRCTNCGEIIRDESECYLDPEGNIICSDCADRIHEDEITGQWGYDDDFYSLDVEYVDRNGCQGTDTFTIRGDTMADLKKDGAIVENRSRWCYHWKLAKHISDDPEVLYLKKFFEDFERNSLVKICYDEAEETTKEQPALVSSYEF